MDRYAVFTKQKFNSIAELSISNKIIEREKKVKVVSIIQDWVNNILPGLGYVVYFKNDFIDGNNLDIQSLVMCTMTSDAPYNLIVIKKDSNVCIRIGTYETSYETRKVK